MSDPLILIPARMAATRFPGKPLADIATDAPEIMHVVEQAGGIAILTSTEHLSGSDRINEAADLIDPDGNHDVVINLQGDFPTITPEAIASAIIPLSDPAVDIATLAAEITDEEEKTAPSVVKLIGTPAGPNRMRALYFTRATAPTGDGPLYHHVGIYAYRRAALKRFVSLPASPLELREKLEQLRALEAGMRIDAMMTLHVPRGVDTPEDLVRARLALLA
jgi:3-deoxy-manno-octulosonate cytidylyltransferase (CMP-KDO synthetase)